MLAEIDPGIPYCNSNQQIADIPALVLLEESQHGGQGKYGRAMAGGEAAESDMGDAVDKISVLPRIEELLWAGHGEP